MKNYEKFIPPFVRQRLTGNDSKAASIIIKNFGLSWPRLGALILKSDTAYKFKILPTTLPQ